MGLQCEWCHTRKWWSWEFEDFEKESVGRLTLDDVGRELKLGSDHDVKDLRLGHVDRQLGSLPFEQTVEVEVRLGSW